MAKSDWYKQMSVYQIWPRSFCDGNGDGIGDLWGVLQKLDYIKSLGVDAIWFSPLYPSPNADWGYDISDYMDIHPDFGNLDVFKQVLREAHRRNLRAARAGTTPTTTITTGARQSGAARTERSAFPQTTGPASSRARPGSMTAT